MNVGHANGAFELACIYWFILLALDADAKVRLNKNYRPTK